MSRRQAKMRLSQSTIDSALRNSDILANCSQYPRDEAPAAYKDFAQVLESVLSAVLASEVAKRRARLVIKDGIEPDD